MFIEGMGSLENVLNQQETKTETETEETNPEGAQQEEELSAEDTEATEENSEEVEETTEEEKEKDPEVDPEELFTGSKANQAFAQMRKKVSGYERVVGQFAKILGVTDTEPEKVLQALNEKQLEYEAKAQKIPVELLKRLDETERINREREAEVLRNNANLSFQRLKDTYKLNTDDLAGFAKQLIDAGKDPYSQPMDLLQEYRALNFDKLLQKAKDEAAQEALKKKENTAKTSTSPSKTKGKDSGPVKEIKTFSDFERALSGFGK